MHSERRNARRGCGLIPPNPNQWENEHNGLDLRADLGITVDVPLPHEQAFALYPHIKVLPHGDIPAAAIFIEHLRTAGSASWSGLALRINDELELVLYNDAHRTTRVRATLMEELFHIRLNHPRSQIRLLSPSPTGRTYDGQVESAAYGSGAAALVPYAALKKMIAAGATASMVARAFEVSSDLVNFRMKVTRLYSRQRRSARRQVF
jgi:hypothetical protein